MDALGYAVILGYDAAGFKTSVKDVNGNALWTGTPAYGISPFLVGEWDVDRGTWGYTVDALGERTAWTDPTTSTTTRATMHSPARSPVRSSIFSRSGHGDRARKPQSRQAC